GTAAPAHRGGPALPRRGHAPGRERGRGHRAAGGPRRRGLRPGLIGVFRRFCVTVTATRKRRNGRDGRGATAHDGTVRAIVGDEPRRPCRGRSTTEVV